MKHFYAVLLICIFISTQTFGQKRTVSGTIKDSISNTLLEAATVSVFTKDSAIVTYQLSDSYGAFSLKDIPATDSLRLNVTYVGYAPYNKILVSDSLQYHINVFLAPAYNDSQTVTVTSYVPVRMNGDTLEINPAAFKMDENAVIEDLLAKVPGLTIWSDGTITMNGRKIPNILVDGQPFLGSDDPRLATQNLPKTAVDKIQLYQEVDRTARPDETRPKDSLLTMNIKLKEDKKTGYFGKAGAGYGTDNRYVSELSLQMYNKKTSFGIGGGYNNINKNINNLSELFQNNTYRNYNPNLYNVGNFNANGVNKNHSIGGMFTHNFIESANSRQNNRITVDYVKSGNESYLTNFSQQNRTTLDNPQFVQDNSINKSTSGNHALGIRYVKTNSYYDNFAANGNASINRNRTNTKTETNVWDTLNSLQSSNTMQSNMDSRYNSQSLSVNYSKNNREKPLGQFFANLSINKNNSVSNRFVESRFRSYTQSAQNTFYNRHYYDHNHQFNANANLVYNGFKRLIFGRYNLFGIDLNLAQNVNYNKNSTTSNVGDFDSALYAYVPNRALTYNNIIEKFEYSPNIRVSKNIFKWNEKRLRSFYFSVAFIEDLKNERSMSSIKARNLSRSFDFFRYEGNISYNNNKLNRYNYYLNLNYQKDFDYPSIDQLYTITDNLDAYNVRIGNPNLKNNITHSYNFSGNINSQKPNATYGYNGGFNMSYAKILNPVIDSLINDASGKRFYYSTNAKQNQVYNLNFNFNITRRLGKNNIQLSYDGAYNKNATPVFIDNVYSETNALTQSHRINVQLDLHALAIINVGKTYTHYSSIQSATGLNSFKNFSDISNLRLTINYPKEYTISTTIDYTRNSNIKKPVMLWNAFATHRFLKNQQMELKFSAMDILKQFRNISNYADIYGTTTVTTNGLQQFFLLTFSYYPRKFGKTTIKQQEIKQEW